MRVILSYQGLLFKQGMQNEIFLVKERVVVSNISSDFMQKTSIKKLTVVQISMLNILDFYAS